MCSQTRPGWRPETTPGTRTALTVPVADGEGRVRRGDRPACRSQRKSSRLADVAPLRQEHEFDVAGDTKLLFDE